MPARYLHITLRRYLLAVLSVCAAMLLTRLLRGAGDAGITPLFFAAVLLSAWYGGVGPGFLATLLSSAATAWFIVEEGQESWAHIPDHVLRLIVFSVVSVITSSLHGALNKAAEESTNARKAAEAASEAKSRFLAMVSHELRTPLNPVLMLTEMLEKDTSLSPQVKDDIRTIRRNVDLEIRLIDDLVDLTRISVGKMKLRESNVNLYEPLQAAIDVCRDDISEKQLELATHFNATASTLVGDPVRLQQVFWNLIRNAIKFTPEAGVITINVAAMSNSIQVTISDTGMGIDPQKLSTIFQAFEQGDPDIQARFGGLGLGLAICQAMVEAHHGTISASSPGKGRGASFTVILPLGTGADPSVTACAGHTTEPLSTTNLPSYPQGALRGSRG